jgi:flagellar biosynthesis protein FlhA
MNIFSLWLSQNRDLLLVGAVIGILCMLFVPVPPVLLDILLIFNFSIALLVLLLTFYSDKPTSFSTFPSLLLIVTLFRLALNIASTRLILNDGEAGKVIESIGIYVVGGNYVIGLVVFFILVMVQYVVVTSGAQRVAEVAARFTLDSLPGKQMSIDADLNMGLIGEDGARERRLTLEKEANFYGSMDGASKFVKGDAIAGIILIFINIIGGLAVGVAQLGMDWSKAVHTYTLLTVGDGIVTQIPSLIISTATGLLITRAATDARLSQEIGQQMGSSPKSLMIVATMLGFAMLLPGLPKVPVFIAFVTFAACGYLVWRTATRQQQLSLQDEIIQPSMQNSNQSTSLNSAPEQMLNFYPLELLVNADLFDFVQNKDPLKQRFETFRQQFARNMGMVLPELRLQSSADIAANTYQIRIHGSQLAIGTIYPEQLLVIDHKAEFQAVKGESTKEPTFGLAAMWIELEQEKLARAASYTVVDPGTVLLTHLTELMRTHASELLSRQEVERLLNRLDKANQSMVDELVPALLSLSDIQKVLQQLLIEKVSIKPLPLILEALVENARKHKEPMQLVEFVRQKMKLHLVEALLDKEGKLQILTLEGVLEQNLVQGLQQDGTRQFFAVNPQLAEHLIQQLTSHSERLIAARLPVVLLCYPQLRLPLKQLIDRVLPHMHVLALNEIPTTVSVKNAGLILQYRQAA